MKSGATLADKKTDRDQSRSECPSGRRLQLVTASSIAPRPVRWLWKDRIALGTIALLAGREGIGKSICGYTLAADITQGRLDGVYRDAPRSVVWPLMRIRGLTRSCRGLWRLS